MSSSTVRGADWTRQRERGSLPAYRFFVWFSLRIGRAPGRLILRVAAVYFTLFGGVASRASREYLQRVADRAPTFAARCRHFFAFAATLQDRIFFLKDRFDLFDLRVQGVEHLAAGGVLLMGAHLGSFEALRAAGRGIGGRRVAMAMYEGNATKATAVLSAIDPNLRTDVISLGRVDSMLELQARLDAGALVGVLADRTLEGDTQGSIELEFLGAPARFPLGPMRMAAVLRQPVVFMSALYRGGNRYDVAFEPLADFTGVARGERDTRVREAVAKYAALLERRCREAPENWFNFYPFWET